MHSKLHIFRNSLLLLAALHCAPSLASDADEIVVKIGHVGPTSGMISHLGKENEYGAQLAIEDLNQRGWKIGGKRARFELLAKDDAANPEIAKSVARELVAAKVAGVVGHLNSGTSIPAGEIYAAAGIPQVSPSATNPRLTARGHKTVFRLIVNDSHMSIGLAGWSVQQIIEPSFFIVDDGSPYGKGVADVFANAIAILGGTIEAREQTDNKAQSFDAIVQKMKSAKSNWVFYGGMDSQAGPLFKQMRAAGVNMRMLGSDGICTEQIVKFAGGEIPFGQVVCAEPGGILRESRIDYKNFLARFEKRFNTKVQLYAAYAYDGVMVLAEAMRAADSIEPSIYLDKLAKINHDGLSGQISFDAFGDLLNARISIYTYRNSRRSLLSKGTVPG